MQAQFNKLLIPASLWALWRIQNERRSIIGVMENSSEAMKKVRLSDQHLSVLYKTPFHPFFEILDIHYYIKLLEGGDCTHYWLTVLREDHRFKDQEDIRFSASEQALSIIESSAQEEPDVEVDRALSVEGGGGHARLHADPHTSHVFHIFATQLRDMLMEDLQLFLQRIRKRDTREVGVIIGYISGCTAALMVDLEINVRRDGSTFQAPYAKLIADQLNMKTMQNRRMVEGIIASKGKRKLVEVTEEGKGKKKR
ncbi:hypothetical protein QJS10_CPA06g00877 [Acorus calamus]|uniref:Uncharacterized protein n=1 Tax=Acorus calamus TaxID=4465 RepID=A0AAV9EKV9_ACOCL|nr:hypothetical protein QJS10_CPA06g00877 [Acorus calamus]